MTKGRYLAWFIAFFAFFVLWTMGPKFVDAPPKTPRAGASPRAAPGQPPPRNPAPSYKWRVSADGIGPVKVGMSIDQAAAALGEYFAFSDIDRRAGTRCDYAEWPGAPEGAHVVVDNDTVVGVWVLNGEVTTEEHLKIGDRADLIESRYPGLAADKRPNPDHYYGRAFALVIPAPGDSSRRLVYEIADSVIQSFRAGRYRDILDQHPCR